MGQDGLKRDPLPRGKETGHQGLPQAGGEPGPGQQLQRTLPLVSAFGFFVKKFLVKLMALRNVP